MVDAVVLGGGFYGCKVALALHNVGLKVVIVEPNKLMSMATMVNQARVHSGMHYPRYFKTALSAAKHYRRFTLDHWAAMIPNKQHFYAIAKGSKTSPTEFERVAREIGAPITDAGMPTIFDPSMVDAVYNVEEASFDVDILRDMTIEHLDFAHIQRIKGWGAIGDVTEHGVKVTIVEAGGLIDVIEARYVFNCTYAQLDHIIPLRTRLKKEWTEVALCKVHPTLLDTDITVMDGPYWSLMKYPPGGGLHALTHVTYTPHTSWLSGEFGPRYTSVDSNFPSMRDDAMRFVPRMEQTEYVRSLWTTRVVLAQNEEDDGRPILWEYAEKSPRIISILGSKFNSFYDAVDEIERGEWMRPNRKTGVMRVGRRALVGHTGFVGSSLVAEGRFTDYSNSTTPLEPGHYSQIVCTALKGTKWWANKNPDVDRAMLEKLQNMLRTVTTDEFVLISTIDAIGPSEFLVHYGRHRQQFEDWVKQRFPKVRILRLPALFGPGLKKNALYDLLHGKSLTVHPWSTFQWYPIERLWQDIEEAHRSDITDWNLVTPPIEFGWLINLVDKNRRDHNQPIIRYNVTDPRGYVLPVDDVRRLLRRFVCETSPSSSQSSTE